MSTTPLPRSYCLVGVTGGIGTGKTTVCRHIGRTFPILGTDVIAREISETDQLVGSQLRELFGSDIYSSEGTLDRGQLAERVFTNRQLLDELNAILHPPVLARVQREVEILAQKGASLIFVESALIFETNITDLFDVIICVTAPESVVMERAKAHSPDSAERLKDRMAMQLPQERKAEGADFVIHNAGSLSELERNVDFILRLLPGLCKRS